MRRGSSLPSLALAAGLVLTLALAATSVLIPVLMRVIPPTVDAPTSIGVVEKTSRDRPDQRYYLYVPTDYDGSTEFRLLVVMHGRKRRAEAYAEQFTGFADAHHYIILAPLFPEPERYQQLGIGDDTIRADLRLLELVDELGRSYRVESTSFDLFGFSAGAQFAHRFMYVHPERLRSVVAAAPGTVTLPTDRYPWPSGVADLEEVANVRLELGQVRRIHSMLIVGEDDVGSGSLNRSDEANRFGRTRLQRARTLHQTWLDAGIDHVYVELSHVGHVLDERIAEQATRFLATV